jgi:transcriptional regulator with XRE-family HTH domain
MITSKQVKAALAMLGWKVSDLASASGVSEPTIWRLETADGPLGGRPETAAKLCEALEGAGVIFIEENGEGPGVRLRKAKRGRK